MTGRPRNTALDTAILAATLSILRTDGYAGLRVADVAKRARVPKTTIYRRWKSRTHLVVAAMEHALGDVPASTSDDPIGRITALLLFRSHSLAGNDDSLLGVALELHRSNDLELQEQYRQRIIDPVRNEIIAALEELLAPRSEDRGADARHFADAIIGGLFYKSSVLGETLSETQIERYLQSLLRSLRP